MRLVVKFDFYLGVKVSVYLGVEVSMYLGIVGVDFAARQRWVVTVDARVDCRIVHLPHHALDAACMLESIAASVLF